MRRLASGEPRGKGKEKEEDAVHGLFLSGFARIDQFPKLWIFGENLVLRKGELGAEGKVLQGVFVENAVDDQAFLRFFEIDPVFVRTVPVQGAVGPANDAKAVGMFFEKIGGEDIKFPKDLHLERGG
jgi:hypothetical protein